MRSAGWVACTTLAVVASCAAALRASVAAPTGPDFAREIRPILSRRCFKCHGPDDRQRQAGLRLDTRDSAVLARAGRRAITPGRPEQSQLYRRVTSPHPGTVMPPPATKERLTATEVDLLRRWIAAGAEYRPHWAFLPPRAVDPPADASGWSRNPIDRFVLARVRAAGLQPSAEADAQTLVRRVSLDLIGLPPTPAEVDAFLNDRDPGAYERLVDRLLASPQYGERWARKWLDLARYADTNGYEKDRPRSIWPYRDWVIAALNQDMPFDQFSIRQIAGDLLPGASQEDRIATGFHRNTMLNEEGGIDPLEFRFHAMTDRVNTTATIWLGLTMGCVQCHSHKYDPIQHSEYYQFLACLNNTEEVDLDVVTPEIAARRDRALAEIAEREARLPDAFPPRETLAWQPAVVRSVTVESGAAATNRADGAILIGRPTADTDRYTLTLDVPAGPAPTAVRLEALTDPSLGGGGPGRTPHGNFVLTELTVSSGSSGKQRILRGTADFTQEGFSAAAVYDGDPKTGWAIHGPGKWNTRRVAEYHWSVLPEQASPTQWTVTLDQQYGGGHTLGCFRLSWGYPDPAVPRLDGRAHLEARFQEWLSQESGRATRWSVPAVLRAGSNLPRLVVQPDRSVLVDGDQSKRDVYEVTLAKPAGPVAAVRLEALPDPSLPKNGPGRVYYEGPIGDFFLSEVRVFDGEKRLKLSGAAQTFAAGLSTAARCLDEDPQTGWSINGAQGQPQYALFQLETPTEIRSELRVTLIFERYYAAGLGRFRLSTSMKPGSTRLPAAVEDLLALPSGQQTPEQIAQLRRGFLEVAQELATERAEIQRLRGAVPSFPTTLVMRERAPANPRPTHVHRRGEYLQPTSLVQPAAPAVLHPLAGREEAARLRFARWLVSPSNPLVGRVTVNRAWAAFFGTGLVRTAEDFGSQGEPPSHPELLDWLAQEFIRQGWSTKKLHRLIVTSATYRQSSRVTPERHAADPQNRLLSRMPRLRLEAEQLRDSLLRVSGLLSSKMGGPSVFPPQPAGVTSEGTYGPLAWNVSTGEDRYRRGLYTFAKRTAPYAMAATFDAPSGEACQVKRESTNSALQALTMLNDQVCLESARALAASVMAEAADPRERLRRLWLRALCRPPGNDEVGELEAFREGQLRRLRAGELKPEPITGDSADVDRASWVLLARAVFNLDEFISRR